MRIFKKNNNNFGPFHGVYCVVVQVLEDVTGEEFVLLMRVLSGMKSLQTVSGRQQLVELVVEQAFLEQALNPADADSVDRLLQCTRQALPLFSVRCTTAQSWPLQNCSRCFYYSASFVLYFICYKRQSVYWKCCFTVLFKKQNKTLNSGFIPIEKRAFHSICDVLLWTCSAQPQHAHQPCGRTGHPARSECRNHFRFLNWCARCH